MFYDLLTKDTADLFSNHREAHRYPEVLFAEGFRVGRRYTKAWHEEIFAKGNEPPEALEDCRYIDGVSDFLDKRDHEGGACAPFIWGFVFGAVSHPIQSLKVYRHFKNTYPQTA